MTELNYPRKCGPVAQILLMFAALLLWALGVYALMRVRFEDTFLNMILSIGWTTFAFFASFIVYEHFTRHPEATE